MKAFEVGNEEVERYRCWCGRRMAKEVIENF